VHENVPPEHAAVQGRAWNAEVSVINSLRLLPVVGLMAAWLVSLDDGRAPATSASLRHRDAAASRAASRSSRYDARIIRDSAAAYWPMSGQDLTEGDLTGNGHLATYRGGSPRVTSMPNGDPAVVFDGAKLYLEVRSAPALSIARRGSLSWEMWIRPDTLQFAHADPKEQYVSVMGKCRYAPVECEWSSRFYGKTTPTGRSSRMSAYAFPEHGGKGSGADWQPAPGVIRAGMWLHIVGRYTTSPVGQPAICDKRFPGTIDITVNGVPWSQRAHGNTGCMSQFGVIPQETPSPLTIGMMGLGGSPTFFGPGAIGKVAIYDYRLTDAQIVEHYRLMSGREPVGSCAATCRF
jgi:hypothetical protein